MEEHNQLADMLGINKNDFTISNTGKVHLATAKVAVLLGVPRSTLRGWIKENSATLNINEYNQLAPESILFMANLATPKYEQSVQFLKKIQIGGVNQLLQNIVGYTATQPVQPQLPESVLLAQIELDKHKVDLEKLKVTQVEETKRAAIKAKVQVAEASRIRMDHDRKSSCGKGYSSLASIHKWLEMDNDTPLAYSMLQAVLRKHSMSINTRSNCINEGDFFSELELVTNGAEKTKSGKFWYYEPSDIKFKADWL